MSQISIRDADKYYNRGKGNQIHVINRIGLELPESGMVAVFGRSGCGKTTLLNAIGGLDTLDSGSILVDGQDMRQNTDYLRNRYIGYISQNYNLNVSQTVGENVANALILCGMTDREEIARRVRVALANVGMEKFADRTPDTLSGGQQQRVAIARAIVKNPAVILADEPTGNLDEANTVMVMDILKEISRSHLVVLVTHEANLVDYYCDTVVELSDGCVISVRDNKGANGYVSRNKNDIYLGELPREDGQIPGVEISYYGDAPAEGEAPLRLRVVRVGGKVYLQSETPVQMLTESSEVHLREGVFAEQPRTETAYGTRQVDLSGLPPLPALPKAKYGRLYGFCNSLRAAFRLNFCGKQRKGRRLLRATLIALACVLVFMTASMGVQLNNYFDVRKKTDPALLYLALDGETDGSALTGDLTAYGIDSIRLSGIPRYDAATVQVSTGNYVTASMTNLEAEADVLHLRLSADMPLLVGTLPASGEGGAVLTDTLADELLRSSTYSHIAHYRDLIGMQIIGLSGGNGETRGSAVYGGTGSKRAITIKGIVRSGVRSIYLDDMDYASFVLGRLAPSLQPVSSRPSADALTLRQGEVICVQNRYDSGASLPNAGESIRILGREFRVAAVRRTYTSEGEYGMYFADVTGERLLSQDEYRAEHPELSEWDAVYEWAFDYWLSRFGDFAACVMETDPNAGSNPTLLYVAAFHPECLPAAFSFFDNAVQAYLPAGIDTQLLYAARLCELKTGKRPEPKEARHYMESNNLDLYEDIAKVGETYAAEYESYRDRSYTYYDNKDGCRVILNDADYVALCGSVGASDAASGVSLFGTYKAGTETYFENYMMIHTSDAAAAEAYLRTHYDAERVVTYGERFDDTIAEYRIGIASSLISMLVVTGLLCMCLFFVMRANFMSRIRETGILRAIGVSKRNIVYRYAVESALVTLLTVVVGYLLSVAFMFYISGAPYVSQVFFFPPWLALILFVVLSAVSVFCGILPALMLLRKTPSRILAKYDV